jgi:hypothetical protein
VLVATVAAAVATSAPAAAQEQPAPPPGRQPLVDVPVGCPIQPLPDVVFVGSVMDSDFRTVRFRIDQPRAGDVGQFATGNLVDVRYGIDAKYLDAGDQYLIGASYDPNTQTLRSRVRPPAPIRGGDEIIGATEIDLECPEIVDPIRTMHTDGTSIDSGIVSPFLGDRQGLLRAIALPIAVVCAAVFALAAFRWLLTGFGRGVESIARTSSQPPAARAAMRNASSGGGDPGVFAQERGDHVAAGDRTQRPIRRNP